MPILHLGYVLGVSVAQAIWYSLNQFTEENGTTVLGKENKQTAIICRFDNIFRNCWLNATVQALVNLNVIQIKLLPHRQQLLAKWSGTPAFAKMFLCALHNLGRFFTSADMYPVLTELSQVIPSLELLKTNHPLYLLQHLFRWLSRCGIQLSVQKTKVIRCDMCNVTTSEVTDLGNPICIPVPFEDGSIASLLDCSVFTRHCLDCCWICKRQADANNFYTCPDLLTICLLRPLDTVERLSVTPSEHIETPVAQDQNEIYVLSSVICGKDDNTDSTHFWTYLLNKQKTVEADDWKISLTEERLPPQMYTNGIIYFYERCKRVYKLQENTFDSMRTGHLVHR